MKKVILLSFVTALCLAFGMVACSDGDSSSGSSKGTVPTYQGMTITNSVSSASAATTATEAAATSSTLSAGVTTCSEDRHGWKDYDGHPHYDFKNEDENYTSEDDAIPEEREDN